MTDIATKRIALHDGTRVVNVIVVPAAWTGRRKIDVPVPDGLTAEQYKKIKEKERQQAQNLGKLGPRGFKSRSFQSFQEALERGETSHLMPVMNAKERVKKGEIKMEDM